MTNVTKILHDEDFKALLKAIVGEAVTTAVAEAVTKAIEATVARVSALEEELSNTRTRLSDAERRLEELEDGTRRSSVIISGVPETDSETTDSLVMDIGKAAGLSLSASDLDRSHRLGRALPGKTRPILARFVRSKTRDEVFLKRKDLTAERLNNHQTLTRPVVSRVFISECLSPKNQHLLYVARQLRRKKIIWAAYTTNGRVKVKKSETDLACTISHLSDLEQLVGAAAIREFRPRPSDAARSKRHDATGHPATWHAADTMSAWVDNRRRADPSASGENNGPRA